MRQIVKELKTALVIAESLDDYSTNTSKRKFDSSPSLDNRPKWGKTSSGGVNKDYSPFEGTKRCIKCFTSNSRRRERPQRKGTKEDDSTPSMVGAIRFLGAMKKQKHKPSTEKGLIYVDLWINGKAARALVDTRATDNFIANMAALQFQLNMQEDRGKIKAVNSKATNIMEWLAEYLVNGVLEW
ncbi:hypothetical protein GH714_013828 [Hevea brasiliensis]|uniref:Aspartic peptidase DDI1-type domain-containing protein n=1 Tax=Hevea brasiliensis TaxID=3981 RepID=A0A6A6N1H4_HEVBR|nr:hypothetical protein GH714_013828 [Hevea brasiliensis]